MPGLMYFWSEDELLFILWKLIFFSFLHQRYWLILFWIKFFCLTYFCFTLIALINLHLKNLSSQGTGSVDLACNLNYLQSTNWKEITVRGQLRKNLVRPPHFNQKPAMVVHIRNFSYLGSINRRFVVQGWPQAKIWASSTNKCWKHD
jgi:hypothetical protein